MNDPTTNLLHALTLIAHTTPDSTARASTLEGIVWLDRHAAQADDRDDVHRMAREFTRNAVSLLLDPDPTAREFAVPKPSPKPLDLTGALGPSATLADALALVIGTAINGPRKDTR